MLFHWWKFESGDKNGVFVKGSFSQTFFMKTELSQTTPLHTRNFWKHSGEFQDKILGHFSAWSGVKWAKFVLRFFFKELICVLEWENTRRDIRNHRSFIHLINIYCMPTICLLSFSFSLPLPLSLIGDTTICGVELAESELVQGRRKWTHPILFWGLEWE